MVKFHSWMHGYCGAMNGHLLAAALVVVFTGCRVTSQHASPSTLGSPADTSAVLAALDAGPGPLTLETIDSADWAITRAGLINLSHPSALDAGLVDGDEPIKVAFHVIRHPTHGTFIVDTGVETALRDSPDTSAMTGFIRSVMNTEKLKVHAPLGEWLADGGAPLKGVFLTHLHLDHVMGLPDVPNDVPLYVGPGETTGTQFQNLVTRGSTDRALAGKSLHEWKMGAGDEVLDGAVDVFGDGSLFALWTPGHTPGHTSFLVRTTTGPVLLTGDASHTRWGWEHDVEPGTFTAAPEKSRQSFNRLRAFATAHHLEVRVGHQH